MPTPQEIVDAIRIGLDDIPPASGAARKEIRTAEIKTKLCEIGRQIFDCKVCAALPVSHRDYGEWLYDVVWLKYHEELTDHPIRCVPLVAECEWGNYGQIKEDFQKLLLARASVRLMIFRDPTMSDSQYGSQGAEWTFKQLEWHVTRFNPSHTDGAWLLAAWKRIGAIDDPDADFAFTYFTIGTPSS